MKRAVLILLAASACSGAVVSAAQAGYSAQQVQSYLTARDGHSALRYSLAWTRAEPNNDNAWGSLGLVYGSAHQMEKAISALKYSLAINPYSPQNLRLLGDEYFEAKNYQSATDAFAQAAELEPTKSSCWNSLAAAYGALNLHDRALDALNKNEVLAAPYGTWIDWYNLGNAYNNMHSYEKAVNAYNRALDSNPRGATIWTSLGLAEQSLGRWESAKQHFKLAMALGDKAGAQHYAKLQHSAAANAVRPLTAMTPKFD